jgi:signal transduction histidine kinase
VRVVAVDDEPRSKGPEGEGRDAAPGGPPPGDRRLTLWQRLVGDRPIVTRLVVAVAAAMTVVLVVAAAFVYWRVSYALDRQLDQDLAAYRQVVERAVRSGQEPPGDTPGETFQVYDARGRVVDGNRAIPPLLDAEALADARAGESRFDVGRFLPPSAHAYRVVGHVVSTPYGDRVVASIISRHKHDEALRELLLQLAIADVLTLAGASFVGYRTARAALDPVERYRRAAELSDGTGRRLPVAEGRDDELTRLGHTFNDLLARIEAGAVRERQFLADASHELRTPLSLMRTELEWAAHRPRSPEQTTEVLTSIQAQVNRMVDLANALLDLEELRGSGPTRREEVPVPDLLRDAVRSAAPRDAAVVVDAPDVTVRVDRRWTGLAVANLVANALRHGTGEVRVEARVEGDLLTVAVCDEGPGFPPEFRDRAFDRFTRAEQSRTTPGSGLGLALVRAVAEAHGGTAFVAGGPGARVVMQLPLS